MELNQDKTDLKLTSVKNLEILVKVKVSKVLDFRLKIALLLLKLAGCVGTFKIKEEVEICNVYLSNDELICTSDCLEDYQRKENITSTTLNKIIEKCNEALREESKKYAEDINNGNK